MTRRRLAGCALALVAGWLALWVGYLWLTGYFDGWNVLRGVRGVVVDGRTGRPVAGARVWWWWLEDEVGLMRASPGGFNTGYAVEGREVAVDDGGVFRVPGRVGLQAVTGGGVAVLAPGYRAVWREGSFRSPVRREVRWRVVGGVVEVEVRLEPLSLEDPRAWEEHLRRLDIVSSMARPVPRDLLLDEAYRYVSGGGELTAGIVRRLDDLVIDIPRERYQDERVRAIAWAIVRYCESLSGSLTPLDEYTCSPGSIWANGEIRRFLESLEGGGG